MRSLVAALLLLLPACGDPRLEAPHGVSSVSSGLYTVVVDPEPECAEAVAEAVSQWQQAGAAIVVGSPGVRVRYGVPKGQRLGEYYVGGDVVLRRGMREGIHAMTLLHELGHVLGVPHLPSGLMVESYGGVLVECIDAAAAAEIGGSSTCVP